MSSDDKNAKSPDGDFQQIEAQQIEAKQKETHKVIPDNSILSNIAKWLTPPANAESSTDAKEGTPLFGATNPVSLPAASASTFSAFPQGFQTQEGTKGPEGAEPVGEVKQVEGSSNGGKSKKKKGGKSNKKKFSKKRKGGKRAKSQKKRR